MDKKILLLIEDHEALRKSITSWLNELYPMLMIHQTATGEEGLQTAQSTNPDIAIIDIGLPGIDGLEVTKRIKSNKLKPNVIILTNMEGANYKKESLQAGAHSFINKKDMYNQLPAILNMLIN